MTLLYVLCFAVSATCAFMLLRAWRTSRVRLLLWSGIGFTGIAINNLILVIDSQIAADFSSWRSAPTLVGLVILIWGLAEERRG
jgi:peptidoglycan/LPS O-acetylase OafA/YrhL